MNLKPLCICFSMFLWCLPSEAFSEFGSRGLITNAKSKECARYWAGNECSKAIVPEGWKASLPVRDDKSQKLEIAMNGKTCAWKVKRSKECCEALGFTYLESSPVVYQPTGLEKDPNSPCYQLPSEEPSRVRGAGKSRRKSGR